VIQVRLALDAKFLKERRSTIFHAIGQLIQFIKNEHYLTIFSTLSLEETFLQVPKSPDKGYSRVNFNLLTFSRHKIH